VLRSLRRIEPDTLSELLVLGQYGRGEFGTQAVSAYREEPGVRTGSETPTFAALKVFIDNWRWHGVPFYLRSGKRLSSRRTEISIHFKAVPFALFPTALRSPLTRTHWCSGSSPMRACPCSFRPSSPAAGSA